MQAKDFLKDVLGVGINETMDFIAVENAMITYADHCLAQYVAQIQSIRNNDTRAMDIIRKAADEIENRLPNR